MSTSSTDVSRPAARLLPKQATILHSAAVIAAVAALVMIGHEARHAVLVLLSTLGLFAAGVGFLLRWRVTSTAPTRQIGVGLLLLGLHQPVAVVVSVALDGRLPRLGTAAGLGVVLVAAGVTLRAFPGRGLLPVWRLSRRASAWLAPICIAGAVCSAALPSAFAAGAPAVLAGAAWLVVAMRARRSDPMTAGERTPSRAVAGVAVLVAVATTARALPVLWPATTGAARLVIGVGLVAAAVAAGLIALHRLTAALAGQERYVAGLLEQLAGHERQLQQARACLHDARAAVAGVRAASSAVRHLSPEDRGQASTRADLEQTIVIELARLERMLRMPERAPSVRPVDLDEVVRALVVSHRERGLRVSWAPTEARPVTVDGDALAVILGNLLGNALAHAPRALCRVSVEVADRLSVTVADDGPGFSAAGRAAAFEAGARRSGSRGEGLGLAISRDLARRNGGDLVAAETRVGTCFVLTLPVHPAPPASPSTLRPRPRIAAETAVGAAR
jgi:signal transduction histidine kinase